MADNDKGAAPTQILDFLWIGNNKSANNESLLKSLGVTFVLNAAHECHSDLQLPGFQYLKLGLLDDADQAGDLLGGGKHKFASLEQTAFKFINDAAASNSKCIVHCLHGRSRSAFIVVSYLMFTKKWSFKQSYAFVKGKRPVVAVHSQRTLVDYEKHLADQN